MSDQDHYGALAEWAQGQPGFAWLERQLQESNRLLNSDVHGDLPAWRAALAELPEAEQRCDGGRSAPRLGFPVADRAALAATLMKLHPWRKGPLQIGGVFIDTEWHSDWKWERLAPHLELSGHRVLDVGCGNGYFGWRMLAAGAECVIGIDPTLVFVMQWLASQHFAGAQTNYVLPVGVEHLPATTACFDSVFSMGVLYHRKHPLEHLQHLARLARPGGQIILETLVLAGEAVEELVPPGRYARMRNVWSIPTVPRLREWLDQAGLPDHQLLDVTPTAPEEQRSTPWMRFESLDRSLDPENPDQTIEGHPAPLRAALRVFCPE